MADLLGQLSSALGFDSGSPSASEAFSNFNLSNTMNGFSSADILTDAGTIPQTVGGIPEIASRIPGLSKINIPGTDILGKISGNIAQVRFGAAGEWESLAYADDLNEHHPKYKFLFKVAFSGFPGVGFYHYVHRIDKPKIKFMHQDVNYYNFRTRVLTHVHFEPLSCTIIDEVGNSLNDFFSAYIKQRSGQGSGNWGIDQGFGSASSSKNYAAGYTENPGQRIIVEQVFMWSAGTASRMASNRFIFINARIESFDFDELSQEDSNAGSMATITWTYDAIETMTVYGSTLYSWGKRDLLRGGGTSGVPNAGSDGVESEAAEITGSFRNGAYKPGIKSQLYDSLKNPADALSNLPGSLGGLISGVGGQINDAIGNAVPSAMDTIQSGISETMASIKSGANSLIGRGRDFFSPPPFDPDP